MSGTSGTSGPRGGNRNARHGGLAALAACTGIWLIGVGAGAREEPPQPPVTESLAAGPARTAEPGTGTAPDPAAAGPAAPGRTGPARPAPHPPAAPPLEPAAPERIRIPAIRVDAPLAGLGLQPDGRLEVPPPEQPGLAGWYRDGTPPGAAGTSIVAGHVDHARGPAVFYELGALRRGHTVEVLRRDGRTAVFTVYAVEVYEARDFPDRKVYGPSDGAELRVITCGGGRTDAAAGTGSAYRGNVVVFARLTGSR
jgi:hypothetical protein